MQQLSKQTKPGEERENCTGISYLPTQLLSPIHLWKISPAPGHCVFCLSVWSDRNSSDPLTEILWRSHLTTSRESMSINIGVRNY